MKTSTVLSFMLGCVAGSYVTFKYLKDRYETITQEEIDSVKEMYSKKYKKEEKKDDDGEKDSNNTGKSDISEYAAKLAENGYTNYSEISEKEDSSMNISYIEPEDYGYEDDYDQISLTYYSDGVLTDEDDEVITNPKEIVGYFQDHFGDYEDDSVFVRNDSRKAYYEILADHRTYTEVLGEKPHLEG